MSITIPFSDACERNKDPILELIQPYLTQAKSVLEIGSGTAQHAVYFAETNPHLIWQTSDQRQYLHGIRSQLENTTLTNVLAPLELNVTQEQWVPQGQYFDLIYTANTLHIMPWHEVEALFNQVRFVCTEKAVLIVYGPFKYDGQFTSNSNQEFDQSLLARDCGSSIRDFELVGELARQAGFTLLKDARLPANNQCIIWQLLA